MNITLRQARREESKEIYSMLKKLAEDVGDKSKFTTTPEDIAGSVFSDDPKYQVILAELNGEITGLITYYTMFSTYKGREYLYIDNLYVKTEARRKGIARMLVQEIYEIAKANNFFYIELKVRHDNPATEFYKSLGMKMSNESLYHIYKEEI